MIISIYCQGMKFTKKYKNGLLMSGRVIWMDDFKFEIYILNVCLAEER